MFRALALPERFRVDPSMSRDERTEIDVLRSDDVQITLWVLYELSFRGFDDVRADREWDPDVVGLRAVLERAFEGALRGHVGTPSVSASDLPDQLRDVIEGMGGPALASFLHRRATRAQILTFLRHRSLYHLKESDPSAFVLPRIDGSAKVALAELLYDEYGAGRPEHLHSRLFAEALDAAGLDPTYGAYIDETPASTLAVNNVMSLFGLHRRLRGAALGHLAAFEATSSVPCRKIAAGLERVGMPEAVAAYFHEHVEADAVHEQVMLYDVCGAFAIDEPRRAEDVLFGAAACLALDALANGELLASWTDAGLEDAS